MPKTKIIAPIFQGAILIRIMYGNFNERIFVHPLIAENKNAQTNVTMVKIVKNLSIF